MSACGTVEWSHALLSWHITTTRIASVQTMAFPVVSLVRFWANHHLLDVVQRPVWRVVKGRSREYVKKITAGVARCYTALWARTMPKRRIHLATGCHGS